ncbi:MAG: hypothetical protein QM757_17640 [Paludibaculum sp.]
MIGKHDESEQHLAVDPATIALVIATMMAVAATASWLPAWRASRVDPNSVLRKSEHGRASPRGDSTSNVGVMG